MDRVCSGQRTNQGWLIGGFVLLMVLVVGCGGNESTTNTTGIEGTSNSSDTSVEHPAAETTDPTTTSSSAVSSSTSTASSNSTTITDSSTVTSRVSSPRRVDDSAGFSFEYPDGWELSGTLIGTEFAADADCLAVVIVDEQPPPDSGQAGYVFQSIVQFCSRPSDGQPLREYMESVYGDGVSGFELTEIGGADAYRSDQGLDSLIFTQSETHLIQITTSVVTTPDLEELRVWEIGQILDSVLIS